jgi:hypothetical protein
MATAVITDFKIYNDEYFAGLYETSPQSAEVFNEKSGGAFQIIPSSAEPGDYEKASFFKDIAGLIARRDDTSIAAATAVKPTMDEAIAVKVKRRVGPIEYSLDALSNAGVTPESYSFFLGQQVAKQRQLEMLSLGIRACVAALVNVGATVLSDVSATDRLTTVGLIDGRGLFGDAWSRFVAWVIHSKPSFDLVKDQIAASLDTFSGMILGKGTPSTLGLPYVMTDEAQLKASSLYYTLGLVPGAIMVKEGQNEVAPFGTIITGLDSLVLRVQGEYEYSMAIKGFKYDITNGGRNPADATVGTGTNWDQVATSIKDLAGIAIKTQ